jgi:hypothetical protein
MVLTDDDRPQTAAAQPSAAAGSRSFTKCSCGLKQKDSQLLRSSAHAQVENLDADDVTIRVKVKNHTRLTADS